MLPYATFLPLLKAGVAAAPERLDLRQQLARTLFHSDRLAELIEWLTPLLADEHADGELVYYLGLAVLARGNYAQAAEALQLAAARGYANAYGYLADTLRHLGRPEEALAAGLRGLEHSPSDFKALGAVIRTLMDRGEEQRLWTLCADLRRRGAWGAYIPSAMALAASTPAQKSEVAAFVDPPRWFSVTSFSDRPDFPGDFNAKLAEELLTHKNLTALPSTKTTTGTGCRINQLHLEAGPLTQQLLLRIRAAIEAYVAERQAISGHPMIKDCPASVALNSWAVVVYEDGHEQWHIHPSGWISGVYYVEMPEVPADGGAHPGAIEFGPFPFGTDQEKAAWPRQRVTPQAGTLVLFPSYYAHRTWPTGVTRPRICVAFDVVAAPDTQPGGAATKSKTI
jgi:tetratricopeptide (TPR) repeat protein